MQKRLPLERIFIYIAVVAGLVLIMIEPPMTGPDERTHFYNAYGVATGQLIPQVQDGQLTREFPRYFIDFANEQDQKYVGNLEQKEDFRGWYYNSWLERDMTETVRMTYWGIDTNPVGYIFSGFGMAVFRIAFMVENPELLTPYNFIMAGKLGNLAFYIAVCYLALRRAPAYKRVLFLLCLMPMSIYQAASLNYDAVLIPTCFYLFSFFLRVLLAQQYLIKKSDIVSVVGIAIILAGIKQSYVFLLLSLFAIPIKRFSSKKVYLTCILSIIAVCGVVYGGHQLLLQALHAEPTNEALVMQEQIQYLKANPLMLFPAIWKAFVRYKSFYLTGFVGILGQLDTNFPLLYHMLFLVVLLSMVIIDSFEYKELPLKAKMLPICGALLSIIVAFAGIYLLWTSIMQGIGADFVDGIQGRYFIPVFPFVVLIFANTRFRRAVLSEKICKTGDEIVMITGGASAILTALLLLLRFWV